MGVYETAQIEKGFNSSQSNWTAFVGFLSHACNILRVCWATSGLGPSSSKRRANEAASLKFFIYK